MSITVDATSSVALNATGPVTWSHTVGSGNNRAIFLAIMGPPDSGAFGTPTVTYNGVALTQIGTQTAVDNGVLDWYLSLWVLLNPASGAHNFSVSTAYGVNGSGDCAAVSYANVLQSGMPDSTSTANSAGSAVTSKTFSTTVVAPNCWTILAFRPMSATDWVAGASTTLRKASPTANGVIIFDSNGPLAAGSQSLIATGSSDKVGGVMASFAPSGATFTIAETVTTSEVITNVRSALFTSSDTVTTSEVITGTITPVTNIWSDGSKTSAPAITNTAKNTAPTITNTSKTAAPTITNTQKT